MAVGTDHGVETFVEEHLGLDLDFFSIRAEYRREVELEDSTHGAEALIIFDGHVAVTLRVSDEWTVTVAHHPFEDLPQVDRRSPGRGLDQDGIASVSKKVAFLKPLLEKGIYHIFRSETQFDRAIINGLELFKTSLESFSSIRYILHGVRCEPECLQAQLLVQSEDGEGIFLGLYTVIQPPEDVRMIVSGPMQEATRFYCLFRFEESEHQSLPFFFFLPSSVSCSP